MEQRNYSSLNTLQRFLKATKESAQRYYTQYWIGQEKQGHFGQRFRSRTARKVSNAIFAFGRLPVIFASMVGQQGDNTSFSLKDIRNAFFENSDPNGSNKAVVPSTTHDGLPIIQQSVSLKIFNELQAQEEAFADRLIAEQNRLIPPNLSNLREPADEVFERHLPIMQKIARREAEGYNLRAVFDNNGAMHIAHDENAIIGLRSEFGEQNIVERFFNPQPSANVLVFKTSVLPPQETTKIVPEASRITGEPALQPAPAYRP